MKTTGKKLRLTEELQKGGYCWAQHIDAPEPSVAYILDTQQSSSGDITTTTLQLRLLASATQWIWSRPTSVQVVQQGKKKPIILPSEWSIGTMSPEECVQMIPDSRYHAVPPEVWVAVAKEASTLFPNIKDSLIDDDARHLATLLQSLYAASKCRGVRDLLGEFFNAIDVNEAAVKAFSVSFSRMQYGDKEFAGALVGHLANKLVEIGFSAGKRDKGTRD